MLNFLKYNLVILLYKIFRKKHPEEYNSYKFRSLQDYQYKIEHGKNPYDYFNLSLYERSNYDN